MDFKNICLILIMLFSVSGINSQGRIVTINDEHIEIEITEVTLEHISYRLKKDDGIQYKINKAEVKEFILYGGKELRSLFLEKKGPTIHFSQQRGKYFIKGQDSELLSFKELGPFFIKDPYYKDLFLKSEKHRLNANVYGVLTVFSFTGGMVLANAGLNRSQTNWRSATLGIMMIILGTPSIGVTAVIDRVNYLKYKKELELEYGIHDFSLIPYYRNKNIMQLNLGLTQNGLGLVLQF